MKMVIATVVTAWLIIGLVATGQRGYYGNDRTVNCGTGATIAVTVLAGPVNYFGVEPKLSCDAAHIK